MAADDAVHGHHAGPSGIIFTCTTFLSLPGKLLQCLRALTSLKMMHSDEDLARVGRFLLVNESSKDGGIDYKKMIGGCFPWVEFYQKTPDQRGQAASLNLILGELKNFAVWIHWEESWQCRAPFIARASQILEATDLTQLQISQDIWSGLGPTRLSFCHSPAAAGVARVAPHPKLVDLMPGLSTQTLPALWRALGTEVIWPLFSLRPSINRAPFYASLTPFDTSPTMWPHLFEWEFGLRWLKAGGKKGILLPEAALRQPHHRSTHALGPS